MHSDSVLQYCYHVICYGKSMESMLLCFVDCFAARQRYELVCSSQPLQTRVLHKQC